MKKVFMLFLVLALVSCVSAANLLRNGDFDYVTEYAHWNHSTWGSWYDYDLGDSTSIISFGYWGNLGIVQQVGTAELGGPITPITFAADTVYTLTVVGSDPSNGCNGVILKIGAGTYNMGQSEAGAWTYQEKQSFTYPVVAEPGPWTSFSLTIDTADHVDWVGQNILVGVFADNASGGNKWSWVDSVTLVPEPATMVILGLGALFGLRRRNE
ncbi:MAG: hypothetical protein A2Y10_01030 [Planctomycetes bacterium GWF2_41_51]|nr:MAG: hypothetical protein A2Y10_01030 [Planctomycetes bacterium GWF2_41_51]HBG26529.1 hypothetical protein [Phycisphaerales bacterium]